MKKILIGILTILVCTEVCFSQSISGTYPVLTNTKINFQDTISIAGTIHQGNTILQNALILAFNIADSTYRYTLTDSSGQYQFSYLPKGQYEIRVFGGANTYKSLTIDKTEPKLNLFVEEKTTDIENTTHINQFSIGPNPFQDVLCITISCNQNSDIAYKILDLKGSVVSENILNRLDHTGTINTRDHPAGIYLLQIDHNNKTEIFKLIKN